MKRNNFCFVVVFGTLGFFPVLGFCGVSGEALKLVAVGQALIKVDPRITWDDPFGSIRPFVEAADVGFTNFEMAVNGPDNECGVPEGYITVLGEPRIGAEDQPGNTSWPHAVDNSVMEFLAGMGFNLMSLSNNHAWDLGPCGVEATRAAADLYGVTHAGTGSSIKEAVAPAYLKVHDTTIALVAATTSSPGSRSDLVRGYAARRARIATTRCRCRGVYWLSSTTT